MTVNFLYLSAGQALDARYKTVHGSADRSQLEAVANNHVSGLILFQVWLESAGD